METPRYRGGGWWFVALGFLFGGLGAYIFRIADKAEFKAPAFVGWAIAAIFGAAGLVLGWRGVAGLLRRRRIEQRLAERPEEPWRADHDWDPWGERDSPWGRALHMALGIFWIGLFAVVANWIGFGEGLWPFAIGAVILDVVLVALVFGTVRRLARALWFGAGHVRFERFPYRPGEPLGVRLGLPGDLDAVDCTLRYVEEVLDETSDGTRLRRETKYEDTQRLERPTREPRLLFDLPRDAPSTALAAEPPRYWELAVVAERPGLDYKAVFLLPVYGEPVRPGGSVSATAPSGGSVSATV